jgi:hypothetical protein
MNIASVQQINLENQNNKNKIVKQLKQLIVVYDN